MTNGIQNDRIEPETEKLATLLTGSSEEHLVFLPEFDARLESNTAAAAKSLAERARRAGFELGIASSFRSFERQLLIWNAKATGLRPVLDINGEAIDIEQLSETDRLYAILLWSALPGASRHHWGTDMDVFDLSQMPVGYQLQLTVEETQAGGPFAKFHRWLTQDLLEHPEEFFRPYVEGVGGISPEPWHLSYGPVANNFARLLTPELLREKILHADIALKETILEHLDDIFERYLKPYQQQKTGDFA